MKTKTQPKIVKKHQRETARRSAPVKIASDRKKWSTAVRSWVVEFQDRDQNECLPAFDSVFGSLDPKTESGE